MPVQQAPISKPLDGLPVLLERREAACWAATILHGCGVVIGCKILAAFVQAVVYAAGVVSWEKGGDGGQAAVRVQNKDTSPSRMLRRHDPAIWVRKRAGSRSASRACCVAA